MLLSTLSLFCVQMQSVKMYFKRANTQKTLQSFEHNHISFIPLLISFVFFFFSFNFLFFFSYLHRPLYMIQVVSNQTPCIKAKKNTRFHFSLAVIWNMICNGSPFSVHIIHQPCHNQIIMKWICMFISQIRTQRSPTTTTTETNNTTKNQQKSSSSRSTHRKKKTELNVNKMKENLQYACFVESWANEIVCNGRGWRWTKSVYWANKYQTTEMMKWGVWRRNGMRARKKRARSLFSGGLSVFSCTIIWLELLASFVESIFYCV